jgi:hypothetical protein
MIKCVYYNDIFNFKKYTNLNWIYIGDFRNFNQAKNLLDENRRVFIGADIDRLVDRLRNNFIDYIGLISQEQPDKVAWYSTRIASKSISQMPMFHQYVYQKILELYIEKNLLIVTDDHELLQNIKKIKPNNVKVLGNYHFYKYMIREKTAGYVRIIVCFLSWCVGRLLKNKQLNDYDVFIHSWIDERVFNDFSDFNDSYFGDLDNFLNKQGYKVGRLAPYSVNLKYLLQLKRRFNNIIYPAAYFKLFDVIKSFFVKIDVISKLDCPNIKDKEILDVLAKNEALKENRTKGYVLNLLLYSAYKKISYLIKRNCVIIYPFENQPWEKMLNFAFADYKRIAYQHSTIPYNWLDYRLSKYEKGNPVPTVILTTGKKWMLFLKDYYPSIVLDIAGAIRFRHITDNFDRNIPTVKKECKCVVIALPIIPNIAILLQKKVLDALAENKLLAGYYIKIKPHPHLLKSAKLEKEFLKYKNCSFVNSNINDLLKCCDLMITSGSSVAFESIMNNVKTLYLIPEQVSMGHECFMRKHLFISYANNFPFKLKEALGSSSYPVVKIEDYFSAPDYNIFMKYIQNN